MVSFDQVKDGVVTLCAMLGALLGVINLWKARSKEKREVKIRANQNLVKAEYREGRTRTKRPAHDLYVVNTDTRPVTGVHVDFFGDADHGKPVLSKDCGSLSPNGEILVHQFGPGERVYASAKFTYTDSDGYKHEYAQRTID